MYKLPTAQSNEKKGKGKGSIKSHLIIRGKRRSAGMDGTNPSPHTPPKGWGGRRDRGRGGGVLTRATTLNPRTQKKNNSPWVVTKSSNIMHMAEGKKSRVRDL